ncbi:MAG: SNF2-related protein, partial [Sphaerochaeta sp.]|nr:SNF2-related protein [Sphaerochaeta sp.]
MGNIPITLLSHQAKAVADIMAVGGVCLTDGQTGCGKTYIAGEYMRRLLTQHGGHALYVCKASAIKEQVEKLSLFGLEVAHVKDFKAMLPQVCVCSHEGLRIAHKAVQAVKWTVAVCDEAHMVEASTGPTAKALIGDWQHVGVRPTFRLAMTATPITNGLKDCYSYLKWLHPDCPWKSATSFKNDCLQPHPRVEHAYLGVWPHKFDELSRMMEIITVHVDYVSSYSPSIVEQVKVKLSEPERVEYEKIKKDGIIELAGLPKVICANLMTIDGKL